MDYFDCIEICVSKLLSYLQRSKDIGYEITELYQLKEIWVKSQFIDWLSKEMKQEYDEDILQDEGFAVDVMAILISKLNLKPLRTAKS